MPLWDTQEIKDALFLQGVNDAFIAAVNEGMDALVERHLGIHPAGQIVTWEWQTYFRGESAVYVPQEIAELQSVRWDDELLTPREYRYARGRLGRYWDIPWWYSVQATVKLPDHANERKQAILEMIRVGLNRQGVEALRVGNVAGNTWYTFGEQDRMIMGILNRIKPAWLSFGVLLPHSQSIHTGITDRIYVGFGNIPEPFVGLGTNFGDTLTIPSFTGEQKIWFAQQTTRTDPTFVGIGSVASFNQLGYFTKNPSFRQDPDEITYDVWVSNFDLSDVVSGQELQFRR